MFNDLEGKKWFELSTEQQTILLQKAHSWENVIGNCIIDFDNLDVSISGVLTIGEYENQITIDDDAVFYNPTK